jgi:uncharacterized protein YoxC
MIYEICAIAGVVIFAVLVIYICLTLKKLHHTLQKVDLIMGDFNAKLKMLDSTMHSISNLGDISEKKTDHLRSVYMQKSFYDCEDEKANDLADIITAGLKICAKFLKRKKI